MPIFLWISDHLHVANNITQVQSDVCHKHCCKLHGAWPNEQRHTSHSCSSDHCRAGSVNKALVSMPFEHKVFPRCPAIFLRCPRFFLCFLGLFLRCPAIFLRRPWFFLCFPGLFLRRPAIFLGCPGLFLCFPGLFLCFPGLFLFRRTLGFLPFILKDSRALLALSWAVPVPPCALPAVLRSSCVVLRSSCALPVLSWVLPVLTLGPPASS